MICSQKIQYFLIVLFVGYTNAGMIQDFIRSFTENFQTPTPYDQTQHSIQEVKLNQTNSSESQQIDQSWARGYSHEPHHSTHHSYYAHNQNMDLYGLLAGISFASLLGATIIFLATRNNTAGRRRRSLDDDKSDMTHIIEAIDDALWKKEKVQTTKLY